MNNINKYCTVCKYVRNHKVIDNSEDDNKTILICSKCNHETYY
jgi:hypothetical protein